MQSRALESRLREPDRCTSVVRLIQWRNKLMPSTDREDDAFSDGFRREP